MIILFSFSLGVTAAGFKKKQIKYIEDLIYIGQRILLMLNSTSPETEEIMSELINDSRLKNFDFNFSESSPLPSSETERITSLFSVVGKYDAESQMKFVNEYVGYFKMLKEQYQKYYNNHYKLYLVFGLFGGVLAAVFLA